MFVFDLILNRYDVYFKYPGTLCLLTYINGKRRPGFKYTYHVDLRNFKELITMLTLQQAYMLYL